MTLRGAHRPQRLSKDPASLAGLQRWLLAEMTLLTGTAPDANPREMVKAAFGASILLTAVLALAQRPDEVPLAEAAEAHRRIESRLAFGRVLLIP